ncbi:cytochrome P450 domain-containing protein [Rhizoctonia solani AG-1 IA]|uniref:Cytochrome P450 domain-containing protein n=1 Tax=Thanatephorus cucumeris (strain AG1-IA) TaxID=983506 RepID=L8WVT0_THACA|nr:cytochrome P450 domain-containing protein [Rhizoctonia solani AG-1 IA]
MFTHTDSFTEVVLTYRSHTKFNRLIFYLINRRQSSTTLLTMVRDNGNNTGIIDIYKWMNNVALEMIGQAGVGHSFGVMEDKEIQYLDASHQVLPLINSMWYIRPFLPALTRLGPPGFRRFILDHVSFGPAQQLKKAADVMDKMQNKVVSPEEQMTEEEIISQVNGLVFAGHDTTSGALARTLHLLAQEPNVQEQLRAEIREAHSLYGKDLDYDQLNSLKYLDAVCRESLRLWSPSQTLERVAMKDWILPLQYPIKSKDGKKTVTNIHVPKGTQTIINQSSELTTRQENMGQRCREVQPFPLVATSTFERRGIQDTGSKVLHFELGPEEHIWSAAGVVKPHVKHKDGTMDSVPSLRMKLTLVNE